MRLAATLDRAFRLVESHIRPISTAPPLRGQYRSGKQEDPILNISSTPLFLFDYRGPGLPKAYPVIQNSTRISLRETAISLCGTAGDPKGQVLTVIAEPIKMTV